MARVMVLYGGRSAEHDVSCVSAVAVIGALESAGHDVVPVGISREGEWALSDLAAVHAATPEKPLSASGRPAVFQIPDGTLAVDGEHISVDVVFPVLHGPYGEDGTIQGAFEMTNLPYVGCGVTASAVSMDKDFTKRIAGLAGIPVVPWRVVRPTDLDDPSRTVDELVAELGLPVFVKPAEMGSSVGVTRCADESALKEGLIEAFRHGDKVLVEEAIVGREIEVAVLDGPRASLPGEIKVQGGWYDYEAKYHDVTSEFLAPADLSEEATAIVRRLAGEVFTVLECRGLARIDFLYEPEGRGFMLNEANTLPGFTPISGFPKMWLASGMTYPELCDELVAAALAPVTA